MAGPGASPPSSGAASGRRAVFVDRDGTINPDLRYLGDAARLEIYAGVAAAIRRLRDRGFLVVCVTNQSGIERGFYTVDDVERIHRRVNEILGTHGTQVDAFYYCPHAPESHCRCRKPGTELFERAQRDLGLAFGGSVMIGDRSLDIEAGAKLGLRTVLVPPPGHHEDVEREIDEHHQSPQIWAVSMLAAADHLLAFP